MDSVILCKEYLEALHAGLFIEEVPTNKEDKLIVLRIDDIEVSALLFTDFRPQKVHSVKELSETFKNILIVSNYITPDAKGLLRAEHINYVDSFGNGFLKLGNTKVYIERGNAKPVFNEFSKVFTQAGGQLLYQLLQNPDNVNETYRSLAQNSNVSLGSVSKFFKGLREEGYVVERSKTKKYELVKREELLEKWIQVINEKVLPTYKVGRYSFTNNRSEWRTLTTHNIGKWGGEPAAALLTDYLLPVTFTLFTNATQTEIIKELRLIPNEDGEITVYTMFWQGQEAFTSTLNFYNEATVHPLLIYAQLVYSGNDRNLETAKMLYNEQIKLNL